MHFTQLILTNLGLIIAAMSLLWLVSIRVKDASIVDLCWGLGFVIVAWATAFQTGASDLRAIMLLALTTLWGLRLSGYLLWRNYGKGEDKRYQEMRDKHGGRFWWVSFFTVFLLQGLLMWFISLVVQSGMFHAGKLGIGFFGWLGFAVWCVGFFFESVGDFQMARFKARPDTEGEVMDRGLWRYTRHPNYFGDFCIWWGLFLLAATAQSWWTIGSPLLMSFLLLKVSGVSMLESDIEDRRPKYAQYKRETNAFFPWFPADGA
ncbi:DUF1295 domain-containing protein [Mariniblastus fucicola]|uniref:Uncharacterized protein n=1 Tax=Mariniblastus fucicola TaxID=980251 RepID=A0A5B9PJV7_9BACT|nr:DUF1295 domain-containing protein [Mariniblastus fucicola]QEG24956.1 hypothetical protein MFFC18_48790 [Mariniblastus fucicola]